MCKHVAAVLYGIGARLDQQPDLLFRLHNVDENELIAGAGTALPLAKKAPAADRVLGDEDLSALFGLDMAQGVGAHDGSRDATTVKAKRAERRTGKQIPELLGGKGRGRAQGSAGKRRKQATASPESRGSKRK
jgi:uncharacterized Zn finger protein